MAAVFPERLRTAITASVTREIGSSFRQSTPAVGMPYTEAINVNRNVIWSFELRFKGYDALLFYSWFESRNHVDAGREPFRIRLRVGDSVGLYEMRFTRDGVPQLNSEVNDVYTFTCKAVGRSLAPVT